MTFKNNVSSTKYHLPPPLSPKMYSHHSINILAESFLVFASIMKYFTFHYVRKSFFFSLSQKEAKMWFLRFPSNKIAHCKIKDIPFGKEKYVNFPKFFQSCSLFNQEKERAEGGGAERDRSSMCFSFISLTLK